MTERAPGVELEGKREELRAATTYLPQTKRTHLERQDLTSTPGADQSSWRMRQDANANANARSGGVEKTHQ